MEEAFIMERPRKRLFMALLSLSLLVVGFLVYAIWRISYLGLREINSYLPLILGSIFAGLFLITGFGIVGIVGAILGVPFLSMFQTRTYALINALFPIAVIYFGKMTFVILSQPMNVSSSRVVSPLK